MRFDGPKYTYRWWSYDVVFEVLQWMRGFVRFIRGFMHIKTWYKMKRRLEVKLYHFILFFFERLLNTLDFIAFISVEKYECFNFLILWLTADFSYIYRAVESPLQTLQKKLNQWNTPKTISSIKRNRRKERNKRATSVLHHRRETRAVASSSLLFALTRFPLQSTIYESRRYISAPLLLLLLSHRPYIYRRAAYTSMSARFASIRRINREERARTWASTC